MHSKRTRTDSPLPKEYTRVTNPERFLPLHDLAVDIMSGLREAYEVIESPTYESHSRLRPRVEYARPPITLTPVSSKEAPISIAFTTFPGVFVRCGKFVEEPFPICGCDACAPTFEREAERLQEIIRSVVAGHFIEEMDIPLVGRAHLIWSIEASDSAYGSSRRMMFLSRDDARRLSPESERIEWQPWTKRA